MVSLHLLRPHDHARTGGHVALRVALGDGGDHIGLHLRDRGGIGIAQRCHNRCGYFGLPLPVLLRPGYGYGAGHIALYERGYLYVLFREQVAGTTWLAIAAVIVGVGIMVSGSIGGQVSPVGDGLALLIAVAFAAATVITRRHANVQMMPAVCLGTFTGAVVASTLASSFHVNGTDAFLLFLFGALNLGLGMAFFATGAPLLPSALAALIGVAEPVLGPIWVWLVHDEIPGARTLIGGGVVFVALVAHLVWQFRQQKPGSAVPMLD